MFPVLKLTTKKLTDLWEMIKTMYIPTWGFILINQNFIKKKMSCVEQLKENNGNVLDVEIKREMSKSNYFMWL